MTVRRFATALGIVGMALLMSVAVAGEGAGNGVCGHPENPCPGSGMKNFEPYELTFQLPKEMQWMTGYQSVSFYAVILGSVKAVPDEGVHGTKKCSGYFSEEKRKEAQALFPNNKVFASRFGCTIPLAVGYSNVNSEYNFLAVYGGATKAEADKVLAAVKATGKYKGANVRKMQAGIFHGDDWN